MTLDLTKNLALVNREGSNRIELLVVNTGVILYCKKFKYPITVGDWIATLKELKSHKTIEKYEKRM
jgi:hypothetical protein